MSNKIKEWKTEYKIMHWKSTEQLQSQLNEMVDNGWRVDSHKLSDVTSSKQENYEPGWTIYMKTSEVVLPFLDRQIGLSELYRIINRVFPLYDGTEVYRKYSSELNDQIKAAVRIPGEDQ